MAQWLHPKDHLSWINETIDDYWRFHQMYLSYVRSRNIVEKKTSQSNPDATSRNQKAGDWLIYILLMLHLHTLAWERLQDAQRQTCTNTVAGSKNSNIWIHMAHDKLDGCRITSEMSIHNLCVWTPNKPEAQVCRFWFWMQAGFWWTETLSGHLERKAHVWCHTTTMRLEFFVGLVCVGP